ncbi:DNA segregation ATPase FtsK/SpoIIIE, S-DNA-T family [Cryobacterium psychrotolerans]|uniref:DNA segregation ATPase FtsK/SpoIIIE, S-DNA-T family n=1 Tax=Cryobacterium psychrotolerans TaxID=386301 RepID=A0A1G8YTS3_9MICO|nr:FtsK/SpoIIIE domain-containing protein [Cryobacterium psychrotolerans]TFD85657.1 hypothetical protein E3T56_07955 [Cryobacterium psychrotolerans]SDK06136.1 DNA segregation ATPase FtsK/SpoIIIE, S-DNA-T family [Cryobacterium psychrotolerans]
MIHPAEQLTLPNRAAAPPPARFPLVAGVAPLAAAGVIWAITGSAFSLVFAALGPVIAVASMVDARRTRRTGLRAEARAYAAAVEALRADVAARHETLRQSAWARSPAVGTILGGADDAGLWHRAHGPTVVLGSGEVDSGLRVNGPGDTAEERELRRWAATLSDAPLTVDPRGGIGIVGPLPLVRAFARGLLVQVCFAHPPDRCALPAEPGAGWEWTAVLPHAGAGPPAQTVVVTEGRVPTSPASGADPLVIALAETAGELPPGCATIVRVHGPLRAEIIASAAHARATRFRPELVSTEDAARFAASLREAAVAIGLVRHARPLPRSVALGELHGQGTASGGRGLEAVIGVGEDGEVSLDLVAAGPHAVVGGTTGSGKSELLVTWVAAMAARYSPEQVTFLLVDFKGGAAFGPLRALPHCVGLITDLDAAEAERALRSLTAELRYREEAIRSAGARDIAEIVPAAALPRLVIVVDEFATMLDAFPGLHARFVDIAARGRSLGVHLILCTQRPAGVVRDALLANCSLRVSLRVNNRADSIAVIGTDGAARLAQDQPGRCLVDAGAGIRPCQVATTLPGDISAIAELTPAGTPSRRPWLDPLPARVTLRDLRAAVAAERDAGREADREGYLLGLLDEPDRQRYRVARYLPERDGNLLVIGGAGSGKSSVLDALAANGSPGFERVEFVAPDVEAAWDALAKAHGELAAGGTGEARLLLLDDLDSLWARWEPEYQMKTAELLAGLLRDGRAYGLRLVIAVQRVAVLQGLSGLCQATLLLRMPSRLDHLAAGGDGALFDPSLAPGGGSWQGLRIQTPHPGPGARPLAAGTPTPSILDCAGTLLVVSAAPGRAAGMLRAAPGGRRTVVEISAPAPGRLARIEPGDAAPGTVFVGDAESWQAQWALMAALRAHAVIVFDGCSVGDFRMISRRRELPPALAPGRGHAWMLCPDGTLGRVSLPVAPRLE